jgi:methylmalonyl-CoA/ethylmalonyl-CoA epimerase
MSASAIDHLGIAVRSLDASEALFTQLLGVPARAREQVDSEGVRVAFFQVGESSFELLEPLNDAAPIARFLEKRGEGIHHVCLRVDDIEREIERLKAAGFQFVGQAPRMGAGGHRVAFVHPKSAGGILTELVESPKDAARNVSPSSAR